MSLLWCLEYAQSEGSSYQPELRESIMAAIRMTESVETLPPSIQLEITREALSELEKIDGTNEIVNQTEQLLKMLDKLVDECEQRRMQNFSHDMDQTYSKMAGPLKYLRVGLRRWCMFRLIDSHASSAEDVLFRLVKDPDEQRSLLKALDPNNPNTSNILAHWKTETPWSTVTRAASQTFRIMRQILQLYDTAHGHTLHGATVIEHCARTLLENQSSDQTCRFS